LKLPPPPTNIAEKTVLDAFEDFRATLLSLGYSEKSIKSYYMAVKNFAMFSGNPRIADITQIDIQKWITASLSNVKNSEKRKKRMNTFHYYTLFVRKFLQWTGRKDLVVPIVRKTPFSEPHVLGENELEVLNQACKDDRDRLIINLLFETGVRASELLEIRAKDVDLNNKEIILKNTKYGRQRTVFIGPRSYDILSKMIKSLRPNDKIVNLSYHGLYKRIKSIAKRAGVDVSSIRPHIFRHTFATESLKKGLNLSALQRLLGHSDIKTTQIYLHLLKEDIKKEYEKVFYNGSSSVQIRNPSHEKTSEEKTVETQSVGSQDLLKIKYCPMCGAKVIENAKFCFNCGYPIHQLLANSSLETVGTHA
jgi:integrase/recombinase XerD